MGPPRQPPHGLAPQVSAPRAPGRPHRPRACRSLLVHAAQEARISFLNVAFFGFPRWTLHRFRSYLHFVHSQAVIAGVIVVACGRKLREWHAVEALCLQELCYLPTENWTEVEAGVLSGAWYGLKRLRRVPRLRALPWTIAIGFPFTASRWQGRACLGAQALGHD